MTPELDRSNSLHPKRHCFALAVPVAQIQQKIENSTSFEMAWDCQALSAQQQQDLANALPFLACGEESAVHAFGATLSMHFGVDEQAAMQQIAQDELRHAIWLERLRQLLPEPDIAIPTGEVTRFFRRLLTRDIATHFARVAALDRAVCDILAPLISRQAGLKLVPELCMGLRSIVKDEARHVQISKQMARRLGITESMQAEIDQSIAQELSRLLSPIQPGLKRLSALVVK